MVLGSTPNRVAIALCDKPKTLRESFSRSGNELAAGNGSYPRNRMIRGMDRFVGRVSLLSQLKIVAASTPIWRATSLWNSPRSSLRFRIWSPKVLSSLEYFDDLGF